MCRAESSVCGCDLWHEAEAPWSPCARGALSQQDTVTSPTGHVFPEFKESDAMFAAERVSAAARERADAAGQTLLSCPLPAKLSVLALLHFMQIRHLTKYMLLPTVTHAALG